MPATLRAVLLFGFAIIAAPAAGQVLETVGTRALGMGGAFVAVADDGSATYWNPAGLATGATVDAGVGFGRTDFRAGDGREPAGGDARTRSFWLVMPALGLSYNRLRVATAAAGDSSTAADPGDRQDLRPRGVGVSSLVTGQYGITLVQSLAPGIAFGSTLKLVRATAATDRLPAGAGRDEALDHARQLAGRDQTAVDADIGFMAAAGVVRLGLVVRNLREPGFDSPAGERLVLKRQARLGVAVMPGGSGSHHVADPAGLAVALDVDLTRTPTLLGDRRNVAVGVERWWAGRRIGVRAGARASTVDAARPVGTAGVSLGLLQGVFVEAAATGGHRDVDRGWVLGVRAGF